MKEGGLLPIRSVGRSLCTRSKLRQIRAPHKSPPHPTLLSLVCGSSRLVPLYYIYRLSSLSPSFSREVYSHQTLLSLSEHLTLNQTQTKLQFVFSNLSNTALEDNSHHG